jgi:hypothetical protein
MTRRALSTRGPCQRTEAERLRHLTTLGIFELFDLVKPHSPQLVADLLDAPFRRVISLGVHALTVIMR